MWTYEWTDFRNQTFTERVGSWFEGMYSLIIIPFYRTLRFSVYIHLHNPYPTLKKTRMACYSLAITYVLVRVVLQKSTFSHISVVTEEVQTWASCNHTKRVFFFWSIQTSIEQVLLIFLLFQGELTITADMEDLGNSLFLDTVPASWAKKAYPSLMGLGAWYSDLLLRIKELETWTSDFQLPAAVWLAGFFNPQSFLTAIMQQMARKNEWPLDRMCLQCDVTKKSREDMAGPPREGAYTHGLFMEGARWDMQTGMIAEARLKELAPPMPVIFLKAIPVDRQDLRNMYECPVYKTKTRGPTFVWTFNLKSKEKPSKWILGGVALLLQV